MKVLIGKKLSGILIIAVGLIACNGENQKEREAVPAEKPGESVKTDSAAAQRITLSEEQVKTLQIETVQLKSDNFTYKIAMPGETFPNHNNISIVSAPINGRVVAIFAHEGEWVRKGDKLLEIESLEFANFVADYLQARAEKLYQQNQRERIGTLVQKKISPQRAIEKAEADFARAEAAEQAAYARLLAIGVQKTRIAEWNAGQIGQPRLEIFAPISGVITSHKIDHGQAVNGYEEMMTIINLETVLVRGYASPEDGSLVKPGDPVEIDLKDFPDQMLTSTVLTVNPALDPVNKSITINVPVKTKDQWPKPGETVRMRISVTTPDPVLALPVSAIEYEGDVPAVFIQIRPDLYEKRFIRLQAITGESVIVASGLTGQERVAVTQIFSLKALSKFEEFSEE